MLEILENKLNEIRQQKEPLLANLHALTGAEQVVMQLINEVQSKTEETAE